MKNEAASNLEIQVQTLPADKLKPLPDSKSLGFGQYFSDHWFYSKYSSKNGWYENRIEPYGNIPLDPGASVFHYGQALFEGMKAFKREDGSVWLFRPEFNHSRITEGAERLCMQAPPKDLFLKSIKELLAVESRWVPAEKNCALYLRPTLIGTEAFLGVRPSNEFLFFIILSPVGSYYAEGSNSVKIWVEESALRAAPGGLGAVKAGANYAASLQAAYVAKQKGYAQVLWLDADHDGIEEVGTMNTFFVFKNSNSEIEIVTPALNGSILAGGVRDSVIKILQNWKMNIVERKITMTELQDRLAKGELIDAFGTGTAAVISPIGEFFYKGKTLKVNSTSDSIHEKLLEEIRGIQLGTKPDPFKWMIKASDL
jgi:branched-chain amino acid aminotransferase